MHMKKFLVLFVATYLAMTVTVQAVLVDPVGVGLWLLNFFSSRPQQVVTSVGAYEIRQDIPEEFQARMGGARYLYVKPQSDGGIHRLVKGWRAYAVASFPTRGVDVRESYFTIDNHKSVVSAAQKVVVELPTDDSEFSHFVEIGIVLPRHGGGSVNFLYRPTDLADFYREYIAEKSLGKVIVAEWQKAEAAKAADAKMPLTSPGQPAQTKTVIRIMVLDKRGGLNPRHGSFVVVNNGKEVFRGLVSGSKDLGVEEGIVSIQALKGSWMASPGPSIDTRKGEDMIQIFPKGGGGR